MEYRQYIAPIAVALALGGGCKYGCGKDEHNYGSHRHAVHDRAHSSSNAGGHRQERHERNQTLEHSLTHEHNTERFVKPAHNLRPKWQGDYISPQGVQYIIIVQPVQPVYRGIRNLRVGGSVTSGREYPPKPRAGSEAPRTNAGGLERLADDAEEAVEGLDSMVPCHGRGK